MLFNVNMDNKRKQIIREYGIFLSNFLQVVMRLHKVSVPGNLQYKIEDVIAIALFRKWLVYVLALPELYRNMMFESSVPIMRSAFECFIQLAFYLQDAEEKLKKYECYALVQNYKRLQQLEILVNVPDKLDINRRKKFAVEKLPQMRAWFNESVSEYYDGKRSILTSQKYPGNYNWFTLYDSGIKNFRDLSKVITIDNGGDLGLLYNLIYDSMSSSAHSKQAWDGIVVEPNYHIQVRTFNDIAFVMGYEPQVLMVMLDVLCQKLQGAYSLDGMDFSIHKEEYMLLHKQMSVIDKMFEQF